MNNNKIKYKQISTDQLDNHNNIICLYVSTRIKNKYRITDKGFAINSLKEQGIIIENNILNSIIIPLEIKFNKKTNELFVYSNVFAYFTYIDKLKTAIKQIININE